MIEKYKCDNEYQVNRKEPDEESWPAVIAMGACLIAACFVWVVILGVLAL